ncbi:MAG: hypothetical protein AAFN81_06350 [Bacteroidota bacterium]
MKLHYQILSAILLLSILSSCNDDQRDLRDYYFPLRELTDGLVYEFRDLNFDSLSADYWYYRTIPTDSAFYFTKAYYQSDFEQKQLYREVMVNNGILLKDLFLFENDSNGQQLQTQAEILSPNVFPFKVTGSEDYYIYQVRFQLSSQPHGSTSVLINRRFLGDTTYQFKGQTYDAIQFDILGSVDQRDSIRGDIEPQFSGREIYAEGLGLVYYERSYGPEAPSFQHQLVDRYPMQELTEQARHSWEE